MSIVAVNTRSKFLKYLKNSFEDSIINLKNYLKMHYICIAIFRYLPVYLMHNTINFDLQIFIYYLKLH